MMRRKKKNNNNEHSKDSDCSRDCQTAAVIVTKRTWAVANMGPDFSTLNHLCSKE